MACGDEGERRARQQEVGDPFLRGRVIALVMAVSAGSTPLGAPLIGLLSNTFGPRWAMAAGASSGFIAAIVGVLALARRRRSTDGPP